MYCPLLTQKTFLTGFVLEPIRSEVRMAQPLIEDLDSFDNTSQVDSETQAPVQQMNFPSFNDSRCGSMDEHYMLVWSQVNRPIKIEFLHENELFNLSPVNINDN